MTELNAHWAAALRRAGRLRPLLDDTKETTAIICGSGLSGLADALGGGPSMSFQAVGLPTPKVAGHGGAVHVVSFAGRNIIVFAGRVHLYEDISATDAVASVRTAAALGCDRLVVTNAAASTSLSCGPGSIVAIKDHINLTGKNPLTGEGSIGGRFVDMTDAYNPSWREHAVSAGVDSSGVYAAVLGPSYETPAEVRMLTGMGADLIGMSTVCEVIAARQLGMRVLGLSLVTNFAAGLAGPLSHDEVVAVGDGAVHRFTDVVKRVL